LAAKLPRVSADQVLRALRRDGWYISRQSGSHVLFRHQTKSGRITVAMHRRKVLKLATLASIIEQAGLTTEEFIELL
jgi:predicted RNA binding protein YcfA (HicA-like mRNA interferase family)